MAHLKTETVKAWLTNTATTQGIVEVEGMKHPNWPGAFVYVNPVTGRERWVFGESTSWHLTYESAVASAEKMRLRRIKTIKKQLAHLESLRFT